MKTLLDDMITTAHNHRRRIRAIGMGSIVIATLIAEIETHDSLFDTSARAMSYRGIPIVVLPSAHELGLMLEME